MLANVMWLLSALPSSRAFRRATADVAGAQERLLLDLLRRSAGTEYGRVYDFGSIRSAAEYQQRVPLTTYEDYRDAVERIGAGQQGVLTADPVLLMELTSGSASASKQIPYTAGLKAEFGRAIGPWIADLFQHDPALMGGQAYWSISPVTRRGQRTAGGIPIGFEDDGEYLGGFLSRLVGSVMAVPPQVRFLTDTDTFRYVTLLFLLRSRSLRLISVWNPTFLTLLLKPLAGWAPQLVRDIREGSLSVDLAADLREQLVRLNRSDRRRAAEVAAAFAAGGAPGEVHARLWPQLRLVSCWTDGNAAAYAPEVERLFPQARVQGKGLIATEGFVSFPVVGQPGAVLAVRSHFFEFLPEEGGAPVLAHQTRVGASYSVVLTTGGGLYRYQLNDRVAVAGHLGQAPLLRFLGKESQVSDWFGEKVNEAHVREALTRIFADQGLQPTFAMVAFHDGAYTLFAEDGASAHRLRAAAGALEEALCANYHYQYCRMLGQLGPVRAYRISGGGQEAYLSRCQALGQRLGDIKPVWLHRAGGWAEVFAGEML